MSRTRTGLLFLATALSVGLATASVPVVFGSALLTFLAGAAVALLGLVGIRSVPRRWVVPSLVGLGAVVLARYGVTGGSGNSAAILSWMVVTSVALVLAADSPGRAPAGRVGATAVAVAGLVTGAAVLAGPGVSASLAAPLTLGAPPTQSGEASGAPLVRTDGVDMGSRPRLSERVVMTVRADRPSFWRTQTYELYDGRRWARATSDLADVVDGVVLPDPSSVPGAPTTELRQEVRVEAGVATALPAAPEPVSVVAGAPLLQHPDGTLVVGSRPFGKGAQYTVVSRQPDATDDRLAAAPSDVPAEVAAAFVAPGGATDRVVALARDITASAPTTYAKVRALEAWMGRETRYSLDAPLSPEGRDVVEHFLFESRLGWCEQVASSLVVMLRAVGVPARLATGYVPGQVDTLTRQFVVRERDAHAWTEVWFAGIGWVGFDPTAEVPLSGEAAQVTATLSSTTIGWTAIAVGLAGLAWLAAGALARRRRRRPVRPAPARVPLERALERTGDRLGRPRARHETATAYADHLSRLAGEERLAEVGRRLDGDRYGSVPIGPEEAADLSGVLDRVGVADRTASTGSRRA